MSEPKEDLQALAEDVALDAQDMQRIEDEKARLDPSDPRVQRLSEQAVEVAETIHAKALAERELAAEAAADADV
jgi:hypothetical protein